MTKEQYEKLKEWIVISIMFAGNKEKAWIVKQVEKELDKLMGFDSTHPMEPDRYKE